MDARTWITDGPLDPAAVLARVGGPADGAALLFVGTVRDHNHGRAVTGMRYDAYAAMAEDVLAAIVADAADRWGTEAIAAAHRIGELEIGDASVAIAVASPHRSAAFDACRYIIEEIKLRLPVWKQEHYADEAPRWLDGHSPSPAHALAPEGEGEGR